MQGQRSKRERRVAHAQAAAQERAEKRRAEQHFAPGKAVVFDVVAVRAAGHKRNSKLACQCEQLLGALDHMSNRELRELREQQGHPTAREDETAPEAVDGGEGEVEKLEVALLREQAATKELHALCGEMEAAAVEQKVELVRLERAAEASAVEALGLQELVVELEQALQQRGGSCQQCHNNPATVVALPCSHMCMCEACHIRMVAASGVGACLICGMIMSEAITVKFR